jgi:type IV secretory pathway VirB2 component (pilin)
MVETWVRVLSLLIFISIIIGVDFLYLRNDFRKRLVFIVGVFLVYLAIYLTFLN